MHPPLTIDGCRCCGSDDLDCVGPTIDREGTEVRLWRCRVCTALSPDYGSIDEVLETQHQAHYHAQYWAKDGSEELMRVVDDLRAMVRMYDAFLGSPQRDAPVVEIGAGRGCLLQALKSEGYRILGCEPSNPLFKRARSEFQITNDELYNEDAQTFVERLESTGKLYHAIFLWHVIEHVTAPIDLLGRLRRLLTRNGAILLQAPMSSPQHIFREHLYLFTLELPQRIASLSTLKVVDFHVSMEEDFLSFALARRIATRPEIDFNWFR